jgi:hypothetical protein
LRKKPRNTDQETPEKDFSIGTHMNFNGYWMEHKCGIWIGYWPSKRNLVWSLRAIVDWIVGMEMELGNDLNRNTAIMA